MGVRVIDGTIDDGRDNSGSYRLFTTLLDPTETSAADLAAAYHERWEIELTLAWSNGSRHRTQRASRPYRAFSCFHPSMATNRR